MSGKDPPRRVAQQPFHTGTHATHRPKSGVHSHPTRAIPGRSAVCWRQSRYGQALSWGPSPAPSHSRPPSLTRRPKRSGRLWVFLPLPTPSCSFSPSLTPALRPLVPAICPALSFFPRSVHHSFTHAMQSHYDDRQDRTGSASFACEM